MAFQAFMIMPSSILPEQRHLLEMKDVAPLLLHEKSIAEDAQAHADEAREGGPAELVGPREDDREDVLEEVGDVLQAELETHEPVPLWVRAQCQLELLQLTEVERPQPNAGSGHACDR